MVIFDRYKFHFIRVHDNKSIVLAVTSAGEHVEVQN